MGNRLVFCRLDAPCEIALAFPVRESKASYTVAANTPQAHVFDCAFRGSTCVAISPEDPDPRSYQLYVRGHMRKDKAPMKKAERFIADRIVGDW